MTQDEYIRKRRKRIQGATGLFFIALGSVLLANTLGYIPDYWVEQFYNWQGFLILLGLFLTARGKVEFGLASVVIGAFFLYLDIHHLDWHTAQTFFWPILLIAVGLMYLTRSRPGRKN